MAANTFTDFCIVFNATHTRNDGRICPLVTGNDVYGAEIRFPGERSPTCDEEVFLRIRRFVSDKSGGIVQITSHLDDFRSGIISLSVACCNRGYNVDVAIDAVSKLMDELWTI